MDLNTLTIKKKTYKFEIHKKFQNTRTFKIKEMPPIERIKIQLKKFLTPKKKRFVAPQIAKPSTSGAAPGRFNYQLLGLFAALGVIILLLAYLYISAQFASFGSALPQAADKPNLEAQITKASILTAGSRGSDDNILGAFVNVQTTNLKNYTLTLTPYQEKLPSEVFILRTPNEKNYANFLFALRNSLSKRKITVNEIDQRELETMPSGAVVIVAKEVYPDFFYSKSSQAYLENLLNRGQIIIYVGLQPPAGDALTVINSAQPSNALHIYQPLYTVTAKGAGWESSTVYSSLSVLKRGSGAIIFFPQSLSGGWKSNLTAASEDISKVIYEVPWAKAIAAPKVYTFVNTSNSTNSQYFFTDKFKSNAAAVKIDFLGYSETTSTPIAESEVFYATKDVAGKFYADTDSNSGDPNTKISSKITGSTIRFNPTLFEAKNLRIGGIVNIINSNNIKEQAINVDLNSQGENPIDIPLNIDKGEYTLQLVDDVSGQTYALGYVKIVTPEIEFRGIGQKNTEYVFDLKKDGKVASLSEFDSQDSGIKVDITGPDNRNLGTYTVKDLSKGIVVDVAQYTDNHPLPYGDSKFTFKIRNFAYDYMLHNPAPNVIFTDPLFLGAIGLTILFVAVGIFFAKPDQIFFSLDIPDFPPQERVKVPLSADAILNIFQKVNETYRWQATPLSVSEVKNGFKDIFYRGRPLYITDYNVEYLLESLESKGLVKESLEYYGLSSWEQKTKHSVQYLALMRKIRDICVNNAIPFTGLGESKNADSELVVVGQQIYVHFFEKARMQFLIKAALSTIGKGITIILFKDDSDKNLFKNMLYSSSSAPLVLKMETENGTLQLLSIKEFQKTLIDLKSM